MANSLQQSATKKFTILLADDDPIVREVVRTKLSASADFEIVGEAEDGRSAVEQVQKLHPDVLVLDLLMPNLPGIDALNELASKRAQGHTVVFSSTVGPSQIVQALQSGARGVLSKGRISDLESAIRAVLKGKYWVDGREVENVTSLIADLSKTLGAGAPAQSYGLTAREIEVIALVTEGCSNKEVASRLNITE